MTFYAYLLFVFTTAAVIQAQLLPSSILCAPSNSPPIIREDCRKALIKFPHESNVVFWHDKSNFRSCGTCKVAITKPSVPKPKIDAAVLGDAVTALHQGFDKCQGKPTNATIGISEPISVLLDIGTGEKC